MADRPDNTPAEPTLDQLCRPLSAKVQPRRLVVTRTGRERTEREIAALQRRVHVKGDGRRLG